MLKTLRLERRSEPISLASLGLRLSHRIRQTTQTTSEGSAEPTPEEVPLWKPHPKNNPQCLAYELADKVDVLGYGGAPGGGKSDLEFGLALNKHRKSKIFRREATQLTELIGRMRELVGEDFMNLRGAGRMPDG